MPALSTQHPRMGLGVLRAPTDGKDPSVARPDPTQGGRSQHRKCPRVRVLLGGFSLVGGRMVAWPQLSATPSGRSEAPPASLGVAGVGQHQNRVWDGGLALHEQAQRSLGLSHESGRPLAPESRDHWCGGLGTSLAPSVPHRPPTCPGPGLGAQASHGGSAPCWKRGPGPPEPPGCSQTTSARTQNPLQVGKLRPKAHPRTPRPGRDRARHCPALSLSGCPPAPQGFGSDPNTAGPGVTVQRDRGSVVPPVRGTERPRGISNPPNPPPRAAPLPARAAQTTASSSRP